MTNPNLQGELCCFVQHCIFLFDPACKYRIYSINRPGRPRISTYWVLVQVGWVGGWCLFEFDWEEEGFFLPLGWVLIRGGR